MLPRSLIYLRADDVAAGGGASSSGSGASNGSATASGRLGAGDGEPWSLNHHPEEGFKGEVSEEYIFIFHTQHIGRTVFLRDSEKRLVATYLL